MLESDDVSKIPEYDMLNNYATIISQSLNNCETPHDIICYRGVNTVPVHDINIGEKFVYKRFISTSLFKKHAFKCKYLMVIHLPKGTHAAYIDDISVYKGQFEVLIDKGYQYKLLSKRGNVYEMEVCFDD